MKKEWSPKWVSSIQPRKQKKYRYNAPLHIRRKFLNSHLSKELRRIYNTRSVPVRVGDEVRIVRGSSKGTVGTVEKVELTWGKVYVSNVKVKKVDGSEVPRPMQPSNFIITRLKTDDKKRQKMLERRKPKLVREKGEKPS